MEIITIAAEDVWRYYHSLTPSPGIMRQIAENTSYGVTIYLTSAEQNGEFFPEIVVNLDYEELYKEMCVSENDCAKTVANIYDRYLSSEVLERYLDSREDVPVDDDMKILEREADLDAAVYDFLTVVLEDNFDLVFENEDVDAFCEDVKNHFLEYLARKHGLECEIRRPMYMEDDDGEVSFEEYPYECMEYDDENNPVYK